MKKLITYLKRKGNIADVSYVLICILLSSSMIFAQDVEPANKDNNISIYFGLNHASHAVHINGGNKNIVYLPNVNISFESVIFYREFGVKYSGNLPGSYDTDPEINGRSESKDILANYLIPRHGIEFFYQHYKGYYLKDYLEIPGVISPKRTDLEVAQYGVNYYHVFNLGAFKLDECLSTIKKPEKGGLSPVVMVTPAFIETKGDYSLIPLSLENQFDEDRGFHEGKFYNLSILPGLGFSVIEGCSQTTMIALVGPVLQYQAYQTGIGEERRMWVGARFIFKGRFILEKNKLFCGFLFHFDFVNSWLREIEIFNAYANLGVFAGIRI